MLSKIISTHWPAITGIITFIIWILRLEAKIMNTVKQEDMAEVNKCIALIQQEQINMRSDYKDELSDLKDITAQLTQTTSNLTLAVTELKTIISERIPKM